MNARGGPSEAQRPKEGASADSAEEMNDITGMSVWSFIPPNQCDKLCVKLVFTRNFQKET